MREILIVWSRTCISRDVSVANCLDWPVQDHKTKGNSSRSRQTPRERTKCDIARLPAICQNAGYRDFRSITVKIALPFGISLGLVGVMTMLSLGLISALPADTQLPIHFTLTGTPTSTAPAMIALLLLPACALFVTAMFALGPRMGGRIKASPGIYLIVWLVTLLILALAHGFIIRHALFTLAAMKATA
jgi:hypothetical protein